MCFLPVSGIEKYSIANADGGAYRAKGQVESSGPLSQVGDHEHRHDTKDSGAHIGEEEVQRIQTSQGSLRGVSSAVRHDSRIEYHARCMCYVGPRRHVTLFTQVG